MSRFRARTRAFVLVLLLLALAGMSPASAANSHAQINGSGSSWAYNAVGQWVSDVSKQGIQVVFTSTGSAQGRKDFALKSSDFGVSDIAYQGSDPITGQADSSPNRPYAYLPIVAGGTSFPYHLESKPGVLIPNLRLTGKTLADIFTNNVVIWNDPEIQQDNPGIQLPALRITPVVHSEGSGSTAQFTSYLAAQYGSTWGKFNKGSNAMTEYFPTAGNQKAQNGSDGVMNFIKSAAGNGSIGFDEYSYALLSNYPVARLINNAGYFTKPTANNVAVALQAAIINNDPTSPNYLTQDLHNVYVNPDPRAYALSSYSYMIIPTGDNSKETRVNSTAKRQSVADFLYYSICQGQAEIGPIGYSSLPINLVQAGFGQIAKLHQADSGVDLTSRDVTTCNNPTFDKNNPSKNLLAETAPQPNPCDKQGPVQCLNDNGASAITVIVVPGKPVASSAAAGRTNAAGHTTAAPAITTDAAGRTVAATARPGGSAAAGGGTAAGRPSGGAAPVSGQVNGAGVSHAASASIDPNTGQLVAAEGGGDPAAASNVAGVTTELASSATNAGTNNILWALAVILLLAVLVVPVVFARYYVTRAGHRS